jgi:hypothetical protein
MKHRMFFNTDDDEEIARRAAIRAGIAFTRDSDSLTTARTGFYSHLKWLSPLDYALSMAGWAGGLRFARATATSAGHIELHSSRGLSDLTTAVTLRTCHGRTDNALTAAVRAGIKARYVQAHDGTADRVPKTDVYLVFEIGAALGFMPHLRTGPAASAAEDAGEDVAEAARAGTLTRTATGEV